MLCSHPNSLFPCRASRKQEAKLSLQDEGIVSSLLSETALPEHVQFSHLFPIPPTPLRSPARRRLQPCSLATQHAAPLRHGSSVYPEAVVSASLRQLQPVQTAVVVAAVPVVLGWAGLGPSSWACGHMRDGADGLGGRRGAEQVPRQEEHCLNRYYLLGNVTAAVSWLKRNPFLPGSISSTLQGALPEPGSLKTCDLLLAWRGAAALPPCVLHRRGLLFLPCHLAVLLLAGAYRDAVPGQQGWAPRCSLQQSHDFTLSDSVKHLFAGVPGISRCWCL